MEQLPHGSEFPQRTKKRSDSATLLHPLSLEPGLGREKASKRVKSHEAPFGTSKRTLVDSHRTANQPPCCAVPLASRNQRHTYIHMLQSTQLCSSLCLGTPCQPITSPTACRPEQVQSTFAVSHLGQTNKPPVGQGRGCVSESRQTYPKGDQKTASAFGSFPRFTSRTPDHRKRTETKHPTPKGDAVKL